MVRSSEVRVEEIDERRVEPAGTGLQTGTGLRGGNEAWTAAKEQTQVFSVHTDSIQHSGVRQVSLVHYPVHDGAEHVTGSGGGGGLLTGQDAPRLDRQAVTLIRMTTEANVTGGALHVHNELAMLGATPARG